jgi:hypothetical protein
MLPKLPKGTYFTVAPPKSGKKYIAHVPIGGKVKKVKFGARGYQHFKDWVPKRLGGKKWSHKDHGDKDRRKNYRARHKGMLTKSGKKAIAVKYSPAWFSYYYLW